ncbi:MAG: hypothetical protein V7676_15630 [Parasphingorhabdus sp.]|uniref:hypothetical protein n=1 Tax=Parasphingorhabdus sp. TaxID=2709688 RepID=UPI0030034685
MAKASNEIFSLLKDSLDEAQNSVRAYDTKAQIVGVGYIFALNVIGQIGNALTQDTNIGLTNVVIAWLIVILPIALFGYVLYPARKTVGSDGQEEYRTHVFFLHPERYGSAENLIKAARECDPIDEVAYELLKISELRESKRKRFVRGLVGAAAAFALLFANQIYLALAAA